MFVGREFGDRLVLLLLFFFCCWVVGFMTVGANSLKKIKKGVLIENLDP